jgi:hypothetical protein
VPSTNTPDDVFARGAQFASLEFHVHASNTLAGRFYQHYMGYSVASMTAIKRL